MDLNQVFRRDGLARLRNPERFKRADSLQEIELWSCLFLKEKPFSDCSPRAVLVSDSHLVPHFKRKDLYLELNQALQNFLPTLFMAQSPQALDRGALPGEQTLYSPLFPSLHRKAIASSKCVVSFHLEPLLVAIANRVPAILVSGRKSEETELASKIGIPVVIGQLPQKIVAEVEMYFSHYSWKKIDDFCQEIKKEFSLSESDFVRNESPETSEEINVCTITDSNYLPFFLGFLENLNQASRGNFKCFLLALSAAFKKYALFTPGISTGY